MRKNILRIYTCISIDNIYGSLGPCKVILILYKSVHFIIKGLNVYSLHHLAALVHQISDTHTEFGKWHYEMRAFVSSTKQLAPKTIVR